MANLNFTLGGVALEVPTIPFLDKPIENAADVLTLDGTIYTDFVNQRREWEISWGVLDEDEYDDLKAVYDSQFSTGDYPTFLLPYYSINTPVRVYINDRDIRKDGCEYRNVRIRLVKQTGF